MIALLIFVLSLAGLVISLYFTFAYYGRVKKARWVPEILCAREGSACVTVVQTPYARVFGVPNSLLGIVYYIGLVVWVLGGWRFDERFPWFHWLLLAACSISIVLARYLVYVLREKLKVNCPLCNTAHIINIVLMVLLVLRVGR